MVSVILIGKDKYFVKINTKLEKVKQKGKVCYRQQLATIVTQKLLIFVHLQQKQEHEGYISTC